MNRVLLKWDAATLSTVKFFSFSAFYSFSNLHKTFIAGFEWKKVFQPICNGEV